MKQDFFNVIKFRKAILFIKKDPWYAKILLENYIDEYPIDYNGQAYYIFVLITLNLIDDAVKYMNKLEEEIIENEFFKMDDKYKILKNNLTTNKIKILAVQEKYQELYSFIQNNTNILQHQHNSLKILCEYKLGLIDKNNVNLNYLPYIEKQIIDYQEKDFINHIQKHLLSNFKETLSPNTNIFSIDFKFEETIKEVKKYIPSENKIISTPISDFYIFKYNDCGRDNGKITDYFKVVCFHNTDKIITMFPISGVDNIQNVDLNYLIDNKQTNNMSQIDKFNKRFRKTK